MIRRGSTIGIIGGGQLGKMIALAAYNMGFKTAIYCPDNHAPAKYVTDNYYCFDYDDEENLARFAKSVDVITFEFENIPLKSVKLLEQHTKVRPSSKLLEICQDRIKEKEFAKSLNIPTAEFYKVKTFEDLKLNYSKLNTPAILKTNRLGYDGKGQYSINNEKELAYIEKQAFENNDDFILEKKIDFILEFSALIVRKSDNDVKLFPLSRNKHKNGILVKSEVPSGLHEDIIKEAEVYASKIAEEFDLHGILAIEFFLDRENKIYFNEMAPRPHNSFHWTLDACLTSQFEQLVRAITNMNLGSVAVTNKCEMLNLIGDEIMMMEDLQHNQMNKIYDYGKEEVRSGRKMGHVNIIYK